MPDHHDEGTEAIDIDQFRAINNHLDDALKSVVQLLNYRNTATVDGARDHINAALDLLYTANVDVALKLVLGDAAHL